MADVLVIAGDISETQDQTLHGDESDCSHYVISLFIMCRATMICGTKTAGVYNGRIDRIYREDLRCLSGKPVILEKDGRQLALVGDVGWYDYSMASPGIVQEMFWMV